MNNVIWILQALMIFIFLYSGINKACLDEQTLVQKGQTGIKGLSPWLIKFIGISEILGAFGLILPLLFENFVVFTICMMIAYISYK